MGMIWISSNFLYGDDDDEDNDDDDYDNWIGNEHAAAKYYRFQTDKGRDSYSQWRRGFLYFRCSAAQLFEIERS